MRPRRRKSVLLGGNTCCRHAAAPGGACVAADWRGRLVSYRPKPGCNQGPLCRRASGLARLRRPSGSRSVVPGAPNPAPLRLGECDRRASGWLAGQGAIAKSFSGGRDASFPSPPRKRGSNKSQSQLGFWIPACGNDDIKWRIATLRPPCSSGCATARGACLAPAAGAAALASHAGKQLL